MSIKSRYDFMSEGKTQDEVSLSTYPDPLSINYNSLKTSSVPYNISLKAEDIVLFWKVASTIYNGYYYDDMVLTLNGVSHKNFLKPSDKIYFPNESDIDYSFTKERK